jgi:tetraprenyl-beta-curcumene synthase
MTATGIIHRVSLIRAFIRAASQYWLHIYPRICHEAARWQRRAEGIPSPALRGFALEAQAIKRGNIDGSAAFAILAPRAQRATVIRAQVAFQSVYDYVDTLSEQPNPHPVANSRRLHQALLVALDDEAAQSNYYAHQPSDSDDGYLEEIVDACRNSLSRLPSYASVSGPARSVTERIVAYQSLNLPELQGGHRHLETWALKATPPGTGLRWWETAASAGSSLGLFALIGAAARKELTHAEAIAIEGAYWPWIGALHSLLDSLVDAPEDAAAGQRSLLDYYGSPEEAASRLEMLAANAIRATSELPGAREHALILAGMASSYLTAPEAGSPTARLASPGILKKLGAATTPSMVVFTVRRRVSGLITRAFPRWRR